MTWVCQLSVSDGHAPAQVHTLHGSGPFALGRASSNTLPLAHPSVSGQHAELRVTEDGFIEVRDCGSSAGTFIGNERVHSWTVVDADTPIWIGDLSIKARLHFPTERAVIEVGEGRHTARYTVLEEPLDASLLPADRFPSLQAHLPLEFVRERGRVHALRLSDRVLALPEGVRVAIGEAHLTRLAGDHDSLASVLVARGAAETATPSVALGVPDPTPTPPTAAAARTAETVGPEAEAAEPRNMASHPENASGGPDTGRNAGRPLSVLSVAAALGGLVAGVAVLWWLLTSPLS